MPCFGLRSTFSSERQAAQVQRKSNLPPNRLSRASPMKKGLTAICRKSFRHLECPRQDLNLYECYLTRPSSWLRGMAKGCVWMAFGVQNQVNHLVPPTHRHKPNAIHIGPELPVLPPNLPPSFSSWLRGIDLGWRQCWCWVMNSGG